jgi:hypothetical protein
MTQPTADGVLSALQPLVGTWLLDVHGPDGTQWPGDGRATFEWHSTGRFLVQHTVVDVADAPDSTSIMGCDAAGGDFVQLYSDERGTCRIYSMHIDEQRWTLDRVGDPFPQRFVGTFSDDANTITGRWEKGDPGPAFTLDFFLTYRRVTTPRT